MANCPKCGAQVPNDAKFCGECGEKLDQNNAAPFDDVSTSQSSPNDYIEDKTIQDMFLKTTGRLNRLRYFKRSLVRVLALLAIYIPIYLVFEDYYGNLSTFGNVLSTIVIILFIVPSYCLDVRRLQDMNEKNNYAVANAIITFLIAVLYPDNYHDVSIFVSLLSSMNLGITLRLTFIDGTHGTNDYGADPLNR